ncbi:MAG: glycosyltransferase family 2 protein [Bacteroidales bacterium]
MSEKKICVVMPTYNNEKTVAKVIEAVLKSGLPMVVVNDGATDSTTEILKQYQNKVNLVTYQPNQGKGYALIQGFKCAAKLGAQYAITIDSDGQHEPTDIVRFVARIQSEPDNTMIVGARSLEHENMPTGNTFANKFSNFWFTLQTGIKLPDTQSGFRLYPLKQVAKITLFTTRYESELELMVRLTWRGTKMISMPISVYYTEDRVSHFRPSKDFLRISLLNSVLTILSFIYGHPRMLITRLFTK